MRTLMLFVLVGSLTLAGCATPPDSPTGTTPGVVTSPDDFSYLETSNTTAGHIHDYWGGQERLQLIDEDLPVTFGPVISGGLVAYYNLPRLPPGSIVPQGTGTVEIEVILHPDVEATYGDADVYARTPVSEERRRVGPADEALVAETTPDDWDLPHQQISGWDFRLGFTNGQEPIYFSGTIEFRVFAVRGPDPLPVFPDHPDLWNGTSEVLLLSRDHNVAHVFIEPLGGCSGLNGCLPDQRPDDDRTVPADADHVDLLVQHTSGGPVGFTVEFHGADTYEWTAIDPIDSSDGDLYRITVGARGDSPYASTSLWEFRLRPEAAAGVGTLHVEATAYRDPAVAPESLSG